MPTFASPASLALVSVAGIALAVALMRDRDAPEGQILDYQNPQVITLGQAVYAENCASCHGADLEGEPNWRERDQDGFLSAPPHDASGHTWHHADALLIDITTRGTAAVVGRGYQSRMPGFGNIVTDEEIAAVLAYIKSTWPQQVIETHNDINQRQAGKQSVAGL